MSTIRAYIKPFADDQGTAYADWVDVSDDVTSLGNLTQSLDNTDYDLGVFRVGNMKLTLQNSDGAYSDVGTTTTIFKYQRGQSLVRLTWEPGDAPLVCGFFTPGNPSAVPTEPIIVFEGLLSDLASQSNIDDVEVNFQVLGYESLLQLMTVPFGSIANGNTLAAIIYACLNQAPLNTLLTVSASNIATGAAVTADDVSSLQNQTVLEALRQILLASNSVLYVKNGVVYVGQRTANPTLAFTFYGQGSLAGIENVVDIQKFRVGLNRVFNYVTWKDTTVLASDATSATKYGVQKKELSLSIITDGAKQLTCVTAIKNEFANPKREMDLYAFLSPDVLTLFLLDQVEVDYPSVPIPIENQRTAQYDIAQYDQDFFYADELLPLTIESTARFKMTARQVNWKDETAIFTLREI